MSTSFKEIIDHLVNCNAELYHCFEQESWEDSNLILNKRALILVELQKNIEKADLNEQKTLASIYQSMNITEAKLLKSAENLKQEAAKELKIMKQAQTHYPP
jgi:hypothetical protein